LSYQVVPANLTIERGAHTRLDLIVPKIPLQWYLHVTAIEATETTGAVDACNLAGLVETKL